MNESWLRLATEAGDSLVGAYLLPGQMLTFVVMSAFGPVFGPNEMMATVLLAATSWLLLLALLMKVGTFLRLALQNVRAALARTRSNFRTRLACRKRMSGARRRAAKSAPDTEIQFDKLDLAVLNSAATIGPGLALTAPDLAKEFKLRPRQVQQSLEKLAGNMMLERGFGTADDYQTYRLSPAGTAFLSMCKRKQR